MKLKKFLAAAAAVVMSLAMLTACGGGGGGSGAGVTVKKIKWEESRMAEVAKTGQIYMETSVPVEKQTVKVEMAMKGDKSSISYYVDGELWETELEYGNTSYNIWYPASENYNYKDADGNPLTVPVYSKYVDTSDDNITTKDPDTEVEVGTYTVAGKPYYSETVKNDDKTTTAYCFDGQKLVALVETDKTGNAEVRAISNFRNTNVSDDLFKLPANAVNVEKLHN